MCYDTWQEMRFDDNDHHAHVTAYEYFLAGMTNPFLM